MASLTGGQYHGRRPLSRPALAVYCCSCPHMPSLSLSFLPTLQRRLCGHGARCLPPGGQQRSRPAGRSSGQRAAQPALRLLSLCGAATFPSQPFCLLLHLHAPYPALFRAGPICSLFCCGTAVQSCEFTKRNKKQKYRKNSGGRVRQEQQQAQQGQVAGWGGAGWGGGQDGRSQLRMRGSA